MSGVSMDFRRIMDIAVITDIRQGYWEYYVKQRILRILGKANIVRKLGI